VFVCLELKCVKVSPTYGDREKTLDQSTRCRCISDSLLASISKIPPAEDKNVDPSYSAE